MRTIKHLKHLILLLLLLFLIIWAGIQSSQAAEVTQNIGDVRSLAHWHRIYDETKGLQHVEYFYTDWCIYCPQQTRIIEELARENHHVIFMKINADKLKRPQVRSYPTIFIGGKQFIGVTPKNVLQGLLKPRQANPQALNVEPQPIQSR